MAGGFGAGQDSVMDCNAVEKEDYSDESFITEVSINGGICMISQVFSFLFMYRVHCESPSRPVKPFETL